MAGRKYSETEVKERILFILELRSKGVKGTSDLFRFFAEKYPNLSKRQFEYDLKEAKKIILEYFSNDIKMQVSEIEKHYWELYSKSLKLQDYRECRSILKNISDLKGLITQKNDITTNGESVKFNILNLGQGEKPNE